MKIWDSVYIFCRNNAKKSRRKFLVFHESNHFNDFKPRKTLSGGKVTILHMQMLDCCVFWLANRCFIIKFFQILIYFPVKVKKKDVKSLLFLRVSDVLSWCTRLYSTIGNIGLFRGLRIFFLFCAFFIHLRWEKMLKGSKGWVRLVNGMWSTLLLVKIE